MLRINNRRLKKQYAFGGSRILDSILKFIVKTFTSQGAKALASSAAKAVAKASLDAGKSVLEPRSRNLLWLLAFTIAYTTAQTVKTFVPVEQNRQY